MGSSWAETHRGSLTYARTVVDDPRHALLVLYRRRPGTSPTVPDGTIKGDMDFVLDEIETIGDNLFSA